MEAVRRPDTSLSTESHMYREDCRLESRGCGCGITIPWSLRNPLRSCDHIYGVRTGSRFVCEETSSNGHQVSVRDKRPIAKSLAGRQVFVDKTKAALCGNLLARRSARLLTISSVYGLAPTLVI